MTTPGGNALNTDFDLMRTVAGRTEAINDDIRSMLQTFMGRMVAVPPSVWGGFAVVRFKDVVHRWNGESVKLHQALQGIAETIRYNERALHESAERHSGQIDSVAQSLT